MRKIIYTLVAAMCCFIFYTDLHAQSIYGESWIEFDDTTNTVRAIATSAPDYSVDIYYCVEVYLSVYENEEFLGGKGGMNVNEWGWPTACAGITQVELTYPYHEGSDYFIETSHSVTSVQVPQQTTYEDPYGFYHFQSGDPVYSPISFNFMGNGTPGDLASILLGFTFSILQGGVNSGLPHHLKVITDIDFVRADLCGQLQKNIQVQVVDAAGRSAGRVTVGEKPLTLLDSCSGTGVTQTSCGGETSRYGNFTDGLRTGCPWNGQANCGFAYINVWRWCRGTPYTPPDPIDLARMLYDVKRSAIKVDDESDLTNGSDKFP
jgi:hypothetical protein